MYEEHQGSEIHYTNNAFELDKIHKSFTHLLHLYTWLHTKKKKQPKVKVYLTIQTIYQTFTNWKGACKNVAKLIHINCIFVVCFHPEWMFSCMGNHRRDSGVNYFRNE